MLHAERFEDHRGQSVSTPEVKRASLSSLTPSPSEAADLEALLAENLSPNKRAVVQALIHTWEANRKVRLEHTG
ncbi:MULTISPECIES: hypothetical protein [unclassified Leptolyngbya]|uniref:hypothetical protein n=1 Tax=unclassified Leptolyngbya TaxID=2650499 RepID=UPI0016843967|nr:MULTISPECIES: hypothetical protein [unclassified Leptolyngbya]MBD1912907.1 hypothetical protein [Leptolyngbya sp. FACHB-8]MBD2154764.1 hypothetical protein [Leptolyngbya sp. FACHB-16]